MYMCRGMQTLETTTSSPPPFLNPIIPDIILWALVQDYWELHCEARKDVGMGLVV